MPKIHHGRASRRWAWPGCFASALKISTARDGVMVRAFTAEISGGHGDRDGELAEELTGDPPRKQHGMNTALSTSVIASTGPVISSIALIVAVRASSPVAICRSMFLQHHDRVIDDDPDRQDETEQRQAVQREPHPAT